MKKILLMGNPNVGKSVVFSRLTGLHVVASNYPGTTVEFTQGNISMEDEEGILIDVPGVYDLEATSRAEKIALEMLKDGCTNGYKIYDLNPSVERKGVIQFKESLSAKRVEFNAYHWKKKRVFPATLKKLFS